MPPYYSFDAAYAEEKGMGGGVDIETGENKVEVSISITYDIK